MKLNDDLFDWMTVDANRNMKKMITTYDWNHATQMNMKEARRMKHRACTKGEVENTNHDYSANQVRRPRVGLVQH